MGGRPVPLDDSRRRTVYAFIDRQNLDGVLRTFDFASPDTSSPRRYATIVPQQALFLMNSPFVAEQAQQLARRLDREAGTDPAAQVRGLYLRTLGRAPQAHELGLALGFLDAQASSSSPAWAYGSGSFGEESRKVEDFRPLPHWTGRSWQLGAAVPDPAGSYLHLTATGGHVGPDPRHAAIRRWTAPTAGVITIEGTLGHTRPEGDGVRGRIVSGRGEVLGAWTAHNQEVSTPVARHRVEPGETIDFVVDCLGNHDHDSFTWAPVVRLVDPSADAAKAEWKAREEFQGPSSPESPTPLELFAQVLLLTNEFLYVD
jgi:hypothetical protein